VHDRLSFGLGEKEDQVQAAQSNTHRSYLSKHQA